MKKFDPKHIISECYLDSGIIELMFEFKKGDINKKNGKPEAFKVLKNNYYLNHKAIIVVDYDNNNKGADKILLNDFNNILEISGEKTNYAFKGLKTQLRKNGLHKIIYFCIESEDFLKYCLSEINEEITSFYPEFSRELGIPENKFSGLEAYSKKEKIRDSKTLKRIIRLLLNRESKTFQKLKEEIENHLND
jgi:hypothetical protein